MGSLFTKVFLSDGCCTGAGQRISFWATVRPKKGERVRYGARHAAKGLGSVTAG